MVGGGRAATGAEEDAAGDGDRAGWQRARGGGRAAVAQRRGGGRVTGGEAARGGRSGAARVREVACCTYMPPGEMTKLPLAGHQIYRRWHGDSEHYSL